jgi:hypothetical protein
MDQSKMAVKSKANKSVSKKPKAVKVISCNGLNLTVDNSLKKYANDPFFVEHARIADRKFARKKSDD